MVAKKFGKRHAEVVRVIENLINDIAKLRVISNHPKTSKQISKYRGNTFTYYEMDREFFSLLAMRFKGKKAFEWQVRFNKAFYEMEKRLILLQSNQQSEMWLAQRKQAKLIRREETDVIKQFVEYATNQGSTKAQFYYKHITVAVYKCLGLIQYQRPKLRETLDLMQTNQLIMAEMVARKSLVDRMAEGEYYKTIFTLVKQDLEQFADSFLLRQQAIHE